MVNVQKTGPNCPACGDTAQECSEQLQSSSSRCCTSCDGHVPASPPRAGRESESSDVGDHA